MTKTQYGYNKSLKLCNKTAGALAAGMARLLRAPIAPETVRASAEAKSPMAIAASARRYRRSGISVAVAVPEISSIARSGKPSPNRRDAAAFCVSGEIGSKAGVKRMSRKVASVLRRRRNTVSSFNTEHNVAAERRTLD